MSGKYKIIQSVARAFAIIDCFTEGETQLTLNEISRKTGLNINTTRGLVQTLLHFEYLVYDDRLNKFSLGLVFIEKAEIAHYEYTNRIIRLIQGDLQKIADDFSVSIRLISVENTQASIVEDFKPLRSRYSLTIHDSTEFPLYASATGKLILANLDPNYRDKVIDNFEWKSFGKNTHLNRETLLKDLEKISQDQVSVEDEELSVGYSSLAIPVFNEGELVYSISITTTVEILNKHRDAMRERLQVVKDKIHQAVNEIH